MNKPPETRKLIPMDIHPTPFPGKSGPSKPKTTHKAPGSKEPPNRQMRAFGTVRNPNIPINTLTSKQKTKLTNVVSDKQPKLTTTRNNVTTETARLDNSSANPKPRTKTRTTNHSREKPVAATEPRTPVLATGASRFVGSVESSGSAYHSARNCSKCRFDRLETASYWIRQIKLAESVGKHFVSVRFFGLALDCNAEPLRDLRVELKRYMARHEWLSSREEWEDVSVSYGIFKIAASAVAVAAQVASSKFGQSDGRPKEIEDGSIEKTQEG